VSEISNPMRYINSYLILAPSSTSTSGYRLPVFLDAKVVPVDGIDRGVVGGCHMDGGVHFVRC
jgi:hypothetical protein